MELKQRALLDSGAQVSLARQQLLPHIKEKNIWLTEQCRQRNFKVDGQPLGAEGVVSLQVTVEGTNVTARISCYI